MWRDTLTILAAVLAVLAYFGLTPRRLAKYAETTKAEVAKEMTYKRTVLLAFSVISAFGVFAFVYRFNELTFSGRLFLPIMFIFLWYLPLKDFWKLSKRGTKIADALLYLGLALFITSIILEDTVLWKKIAYPLGGFGIGFGLRLLTSYVGAKLKSRRYSKQGDK